MAVQHPYLLGPPAHYGPDERKLACPDIVVHTLHQDLGHTEGPLEAHPANEAGDLCHLVACGSIKSWSM